MPQRPNVLIVFSDQESHHDLVPGVRAPHQERLAARGAAFTQPYCTAPQCSPARSSLLTGLYPHQTGVQTNLDAAHARDLPQGLPTIGDLARGAGYRTAYFGKWHLSRGHGAEAHGFDVAFHPSERASERATGRATGRATERATGRASEHPSERPAERPADGAGGRPSDPRGERARTRASDPRGDSGGRPADDPGDGGAGGHAGGDMQAADRAAAWLQEQDGDPWLAVVSFVNPHDIYEFPRRPDQPVRPGVTVPPSLGDDLSTKPAAQRRFLHEDQGRPLVGADADRWLRYRSLYGDLIGGVDACLGRVLEVLDRRALWPQTCVVYTSDHGDLAGAHGLPFKGPCLYEELVRVPLLLAWEGVVPAGTRPSGLVSHLDLLPTLCAALGVAAPPACAGGNLLDLLAGRPWRRELFFEYLAKQRWVCPIRGLRSGPWKLSQYLDGARELYHLGEDPHETVNLAGRAEHAAELARLSTRLEAWRLDAGDTWPWGPGEPPSGEGGAGR